jgi:hypothetical protein
MCRLLIVGILIISTMPLCDQAQAAATAASDDAQCRSYGAEPGSPSYIQCRMNKVPHRQARQPTGLGQRRDNYCP